MQGCVNALAVLALLAFVPILTAEVPAGLYGMGQELATLEVDFPQCYAHNSGDPDWCDCANWKPFIKDKDVWGKIFRESQLTLPSAGWIFVETDIAGEKPYYPLDWAVQKPGADGKWENAAVTEVKSPVDPKFWGGLSVNSEGRIVLADGRMPELNKGGQYRLYVQQHVS